MKFTVFLCVTILVLCYSLTDAAICKPYSAFKIDCNTCMCSGDGTTYDCTEEKCESSPKAEGDGFQLEGEDEASKDTEYNHPYGNDALSVEDINDNFVKDDEEVHFDKREAPRKDDKAYLVKNPQTGEDILLLPVNDAEVVDRRNSKKREAFAQDDRVMIASDPETGEDIVLMPVKDDEVIDDVRYDDLDDDDEVLVAQDESSKEKVVLVPVDDEGKDDDQFDEVILANQDADYL